MTFSNLLVVGISCLLAYFSPDSQFFNHPPSRWPEDHDGHPINEHTLQFSESLLIPSYILQWFHLLSGEGCIESAEGRSISACGSRDKTCSIIDRLSSQPSQLLPTQWHPQVQVRVRVTTIVVSTASVEENFDKDWVPGLGYGRSSWMASQTLSKSPDIHNSERNSAWRYEGDGTVTFIMHQPEGNHTQTPREKETILRAGRAVSLWMTGIQIPPTSCPQAASH